MGIYIDATTAEEDLAYLQEVLDGKAKRYSNIRVDDDGNMVGQRVWIENDGSTIEDVVFFQCRHTQKNYWDEIIDAPWGKGIVGPEGCRYIQDQQMKKGKFGTSHE
jgi:hypothetical protein